MLEIHVLRVIAQIHDVVERVARVLRRRESAPERPVDIRWAFAKTIAARPRRHERSALRAIGIGITGERTRTHDERRGITRRRHNAGFRILCFAIFGGFHAHFRRRIAHGHAPESIGTIRTCRASASAISRTCKTTEIAVCGARTRFANIACRAKLFIVHRRAPHSRRTTSIRHTSARTTRRTAFPHIATQQWRTTFGIGTA